MRAVLMRAPYLQRSRAASRRGDGLNMSQGDGGPPVASRVLHSAQLPRAGPEGFQPIPHLFTAPDVLGGRTQSHVFTVK